MSFYILKVSDCEISEVAEIAVQIENILVIIISRYLLFRLVYRV